MVEQTVHDVFFRDRFVLAALSKEQAKVQTMQSFRFGNPSHDEFARGDTWGPESWQIVERKASVTPIQANVPPGNGKEGTRHVHWRCTHCNRHFSEDFMDGDYGSLLLFCDCTGHRKYFILKNAE